MKKEAIRHGDKIIINETTEINVVDFTEAFYK